MILMRANPFRGSLEGVGLKNRDFFGPHKLSFGPKKVEIFRALELDLPTQANTYFVLSYTSSTTDMHIVNRSLALLKPKKETVKVIIKIRD
jgi:hypothetical protein